MKKFGSISIAFNSDRVVEQYKDTTGHLRINMANERINAYFRRNNAGGQEDVGEFKDNKWYSDKADNSGNRSERPGNKSCKRLYTLTARAFCRELHTQAKTPESCRTTMPFRYAVTAVSVQQFWWTMWYKKV